MLFSFMEVQRRIKTEILSLLGGGDKLVRSQTNQSSGIVERVRKRSEKIQKHNAEVRKSIRQKQNEVDGVLASGVWEKDSFKDNYAKIVAQLGNDKETMELTLSSVTIDLTVRAGKIQRARWLKYTSITDTIEPVEVTISGSGDIKNSVFSVKDVDPSVPVKLAAEVRKKVGDHKAAITSMSSRAPACADKRFSQSQLRFSLRKIV